MSSSDQKNEDLRLKQFEVKELMSLIATPMRFIRLLVEA